MRYVAIRSLQTITLLWLILTFLFFFFRLMPGSLIDQLAYQGASEQVIEATREKWGLNDPLYVQYWRYLVNFVMLDFGTSLQFRVPVLKYVRLKMFNTFVLVAPAITVAYVIGTVFGTILGNRRGSRLERYGTIPAIMFGTMPGFFISILLIVVFASFLNIFPTSGMISATTSQQFSDAAWYRSYLTADFLLHYTLPFAAIVLKFIYLPTLIMRTSVVEVSNQDFMFYHRVTGIPQWKYLKHVAKHSVLPVVTLYPTSMTRAIGGVVLVEVVFNWPGIGNALVKSVLARDYPVIQFVFFAAAAFIIIANFGVDLIYGVIDPRVSVGDD
ncbi:ABC transporter permease [Halorussus salinisoli]|uniref:ABC transporter permease n=1 Tax=Halorussus salinisoli TaxID=2558242 RepID=UPI00148525BF|nr:ABC transporter permease [Halorussus salinisoli]